MRFVHTKYNMYHNSIDNNTYACYILRMNCNVAEDGLKITPVSQYAINPLAIDDCLNMHHQRLKGIYKCGQMQKIAYNCGKFVQIICRYMIYCVQIYTSIYCEATVEQLLKHTSGVPDYFDESIMDEYEELWIEYPNYKIRHNNALFPLFIKKPMMYLKGEKLQYNNSRNRCRRGIYNSKRYHQFLEKFNKRKNLSPKNFSQKCLRIKVEMVLMPKKDAMDMGYGLLIIHVASKKV